MSKNIYISKSKALALDGITRPVQHEIRVKKETSLPWEPTIPANRTGKI